MPLYEREVQEYLSANLALLGNPLLTLIDVEHRVSFGGVEGRIDILARDKHGDIVVIEIKRGIAGRDAIAQLQSYMGAILQEYRGNTVRGILVASDLDPAARSAIVVTPIKFCKFSTRFDFSFVSIQLPTTPDRHPGAGGLYKSGYWEPMGGIVTESEHDCHSCQKTTRIVQIGSAKVCGLCGKPVLK